MLGRNVGGPPPAPDAPAGGLQVSLRPGLRLRPGDVIQVTIIKQLAPGAWAVAIRGKVYRASSQLLLEPGVVLRARVGTAGGRLTLSVSEQGPDSLRAVLQRQGLPAGELTASIARGLASAGLPVHAENVQKAAAAAARTKLPLRRAARLAAAVMEKGIDPSGPGVDALMAVLAFGEREGADPRRYRGRPFPRSAQELKTELTQAAAAGADKPHPLQVFNHLRGSSPSWVVIPFSFGEDADRVDGTVRILYDPFLRRPLRLALSAGAFSFFLPLEGRSRKLSIYCGDPRLRRAAERGLDSLRAKFHNMGLEVDDTILEGEAFDGFGPTGEAAGLSGIDVVG